MHELLTRRVNEVPGTIQPHIEWTGVRRQGYVADMVSSLSHLKVQTDQVFIILILGGGVQPHLGPWPRDFRPMAMGLSEPTFFLLSQCAWKCDETNFKLLLRKKVFQKKVKISGRFQGLKKISHRQKMFWSYLLVM